MLSKMCTNRPSLSSKDEISRNKVGVTEVVPSKHSINLMPPVYTGPIVIMTCFVDFQHPRLIPFYRTISLFYTFAPSLYTSTVREYYNYFQVTFTRVPFASWLSNFLPLNSKSRTLIRAFFFLL